MPEFDALLAINQAVDLESVGRLCAAAGHDSVLVASTHALFDSEKSTLRRFVTRAEFTTFADCLDDATMAECDERAAAEIDRFVTLHRVRVQYAARFSALSIRLKNQAARDALRRRYAWRRAYYANGLGVSGAFWSAEGAVALPGVAPDVGATRAPPFLSKLLTRIAFFVKPTSLHRVRHGVHDYAFTSTRRLNLLDGVQPRRTDVGFASKVAGAFRAWSTAPTRVLGKLAAPRAVLATTIHDYPKFFADDPGEVHIFVDGFHPSNYPRAYLGAYGPAVFVTGDPLSAEWFTRFGKRVLPAPRFLSFAPLEPPAKRRVQTVVLALNHAGDWTALINRSDTDVLVMRFCEVARALPALTFIVRPHPTMVLAEHEGTGSRKRLEEYVRSLDVPNLRVSEVDLNADLARGDLFVSEYSQVLIDAFKLGRLGVIANFTGRRSFMVDYEACGFPAATSVEELCRLLAAASTDPESLVGRQAQAAARYNSLLAEFLERGPAASTGARSSHASAADRPRARNSG
jgi:hypothetical protein